MYILECLRNCIADNVALSNYPGSAPLFGDGKADKVHPEPLSPVEQDILQIWQDVLGISDIGPQNNFFELGGNSIHCMRVLVRIRELFGLDIDIQSVFMNATIAQQAQMIIETAAEGACA